MRERLVSGSHLQTHNLIVVIPTVRDKFIAIGIIEHN